MLNILITFIVIVLILGGVIFLAMQRAMEIKKLVERGLTAQGKVTGKRSVTAPRTSTRRQKLDYRYTDNQGAEHSNTTTLTYTEHNQYQVGDSIEVVYLPERPGISALKSFVDLARQAKS